MKEKALSLLHSLGNGDSDKLGFRSSTQKCYKTYRVQGGINTGQRRKTLQRVNRCINKYMWYFK